MVGASETEIAMNTEDLERQELIELAKVLSDRLGASIRSECVLMMRVKGLVKALDAKNAGGLPVVAEQLAAAERALKRLQTICDERQEDVNALRDEVADAEELHKADLETINALRETVERRNVVLAARDVDVRRLERELGNERQEREHANGELKSAKEHIEFTKNHHGEQIRRLERELKEARAAVMNEVSAMIPKAVEAERQACAEIAREKALKAVYVAETNIAMEIVNAIKLRGGKQ
jgi:chromosome segregation ATPase